VQLDGASSSGQCGKAELDGHATQSDIDAIA
jgi:hypothetical protein